MCIKDPNYKSEEQLLEEDTESTVEARVKRLEIRALCLDRKLGKILTTLERLTEYAESEHRARLSKAIDKLYER